MPFEKPQEFDINELDDTPIMFGHLAGKTFGQCSMRELERMADELQGLNPDFRMKLEAYLSDRANQKELENELERESDDTAWFADD